MQLTTDRPTMPSVDEIVTTENILPGSGRRLIDGYLTSLEAYDERQKFLLIQHARFDESYRKNQRLAIFSGLFLGALSLSILVLALLTDKDMSELGLVLTATTGLSGVFIWGYSPRKRPGSSSNVATSPQEAGP
jgi:hypothetical protein